MKARMDDEERRVRYTDGKSGKKVGGIEGEKREV